MEFLHTESFWTHQQQTSSLVFFDIRFDSDGFCRYWRKPDKTAEVFHIDDHGDLWFRSGDIGAMDEQSFVYILDRAKDIIIRGGENISCAEVEQADDGVLLFATDEFVDSNGRLFEVIFAR